MKMVKLSDFYFRNETEIICGREVPPITQTDSEYRSIVERYFSKFYYRKSDTNDEDHIVLFHSNRICLIGLAPSHVALQKGIVSISFNIGNVDRSQNHVTGKGKKGGMNLQPTSVLAIVTCTDNTQYKIISCMTAKLIEVNKSLVEKPQLLSIVGDGYVAVCLPKIENCDKIKADLFSEEQYNEIKIKE